MVEFEITLLFLVLPAFAWAVGAVVVGAAYSDLRARGPPVVSRGTPLGRVAAYHMVTAMSVVFGLVPWLLIAGLEASYGPLGNAENSVFRWMGLGFSLTVVAAIGSAAWTARVRIDQLAGEGFARAMPLVVVWTTLVLFSLVVNLLVLGQMSTTLEDAGSLSMLEEAQLVSAIQGYAASTLVAPLGAALSARVRELSSTSQFVSAVARAEVGTMPSVAGLVWAFLRIGGA